jgi:hypothetical protein
MNLGTFCPLEKNWHILTPIDLAQIKFYGFIARPERIDQNHIY